MSQIEITEEERKILIEILWKRSYQAEERILRVCESVIDKIIKMEYEVQLKGGENAAQQKGKDD